MLPGKCSICGGMKYDGRKWIDFGLSIDWYGVVYLCTFCFEEIKTQIEGQDESFPVSSYLQLKQEKELFLKDISVLKKTQISLEKVIRELKDELAATKHKLNTVSSDSSSSSISSKIKPEDSQSPVRSSPKRRPTNVQDNEKSRRTTLSFREDADSS